MKELDSSSLLIIEPLSQPMAESLTTRSAFVWPFTRGTKNNHEHSELVNALLKQQNTNKENHIFGYIHGLIAPWATNLKRGKHTLLWTGLCLRVASDWLEGSGEAAASQWAGLLVLPLVEPETLQESWAASASFNRLISLSHTVWYAHSHASLLNFKAVFSTLFILHLQSLLN